MPTEHHYVSHVVAGGIGHARLCGPDKLNALTLGTLHELVATTWTASVRRTFSREQIEQLLLGSANTAAARNAAFKMPEPVCGPRR